MYLERYHPDGWLDAIRFRLRCWAIRWSTAMSRIRIHRWPNNMGWDIQVGRRFGSVARLANWSLYVVILSPVQRRWVAHPQGGPPHWITEQDVQVGIVPAGTDLVEAFNLVREHGPVYPNGPIDQTPRPGVNMGSSPCRELSRSNNYS